MRDWSANLGRGCKIGVVVVALFVIGACGSGTDTTSEWAAFDPSQVREEIEVASIAPFSPIAQVAVYFVTDGDALTAAEECVDYHLKSYDSAICYSFDSDEAFEAAEVDTSGETSTMRNHCWAAMAYKPSPEASLLSQLGKPTLFDACPAPRAPRK